MPVDKNHFILACFLKASRRSKFQHRWMSAETWAQLIVKKYTFISNNELVFNGVELNRCINTKKNSLICLEMEDRVKVTSDPIGIFRNDPRFLSKSKTYYYYATPKGELPATIQDKQWFEDTSDGTDLLIMLL